MLKIVTHKVHTQGIVPKHVTRYSIFSTILTRLWASIGVTHSYSSHLFLCALDRCWYTTVYLEMNVHGVVLAHCYVNYRIAGNFRERKLSWISRFCGYSRKFSLRNLEAWHPLKQAIRENFLHENRILHQFARVFFLKSFPLYGSTQNLLAHMIHECVRLKNPKCEFCYDSVNVCIHV